MKLNTTSIIAGLLVIVTALISYFVYPHLPETIISHWGISGEPNGSMSKFWALTIAPLIMTLCAILLFALPIIDPKRENIAHFKKYFDSFIILILVFFLYIHVLTITWNLGYQFNMGIWLAPALAILFYYAGVLIEHAEMNWTIGIRTPWTLSSEVVWKKTHALGGKLFKACAILSLVGILIPKYTFWFVIIPVLITTLTMFVYSYIIYRKEQKT